MTMNISRKGIIFSLAGLIASSLLFDFFYYYLPWILSHSSVSGNTPVVLFTLVICFIIIFEEVFVKLALIKNLPDKIRYKPVELESITQIDQAKLRDYSEDLKSLGFNILLDSQQNINFFSRIFVNPELCCFAFLMQNIDLTCSIECCLEQGWSISINNGLPNKFAATGYAFNRLPRAVKIKIPDATPHQMSQSFLQIRQQMMEDLQVNIISDLSLETYQEIGKQQLQLIKQAIWRKSIIQSRLEHYFYRRSPKLEWYGDYTKFVKQRKCQNAKRPKSH